MTSPEPARRAERPRPADAPPSSGRSRRLFDLRLLIGGILLLYGVVLVVVGLLDGAAAIRRADGIRINLWTGIAMIVVGVLFLLWERFGGEGSRTGGTRTVEREPGDDD